jgi:hypothetical protein
VCCPSEGTHQGNIGTVHRPDSLGAASDQACGVTGTIWNKEQVPSLDRRELVMEPMGEFTTRYVSSTNKRIESTGPLTH